MIRTTALAVLFATSFIAHAADGAKPKADPAKGKITAETICVGCHGVDGNSPPPVDPAATYPLLAGQGEAYLHRQLSHFKAQEGKPAVRENAIMASMVAALSDEDMRNVAAWFAQQKQKSASAKDEKHLALGEKLWRQGDFAKGTPACAGCHGPAGAGLPVQYPRLAGQYAEYAEIQLKAFRQGERTNDPEGMMRAIAAKLSDAEIKAVSEYAAALR